MELREEILYDRIALDSFGLSGREVWLRRDDRIHQHIPGNKWWKLKNNLREMRRVGKDKLLTFGGAFSNHIAAVAEAGKEYGIQTIGIIRGEEVSNLTLMRAVECGMELKFIERSIYKRKDDALVKELKEEFGEFYLIPEGGSNEHAVLGCMEMMDSKLSSFDVVVLPVGTGGTMAGLLAAADGQEIIGTSALKGSVGLIGDVERLAEAAMGPEAYVGKRYDILLDYHCGGYAKITEELVDFTRTIYSEFGIELDLIYTSKTMLSMVKELKKGRWEGRRICMIHTGGIQGNEGMKRRYNLGSFL